MNANRRGEAESAINEAYDAMADLVDLAISAGDADTEEAASDIQIALNAIARRILPPT